jgi:transcription elongation factor SPT6
MIKHPLFKNLNRLKTESLLSTMNNGDVIVRPSSKGMDYLVISWRITNDIYQHVDVKEEEKENLWSLGKTLFINDEKFEDLDEILARHIEPMISYCNEAMMHPKYLPEISSKSEIEAHLRRERHDQPKRILYYITAIHDQPGRFLLSYLPHETPYHEVITVTPNGFRFRKAFYPGLNELLNYFKKEYMKKGLTPASSTSSQRPASQPLTAR